MALAKCRECGREVSTSASACPGCGVKAPTAGKGARTFALAAVFVALFATYKYISGSDHAAAASTIADPVVAAAVDQGLDPIYRKVCADAVEQYGIAKRNGTPVDVCAHAGMVAAAFLQAKDEPGYAQWKKTEVADCAKAGMPKP